MKKQKPIEVKLDQGKKARRLARHAVGPVRPTQPILPAKKKPPKHKTPPGADVD